MIKKSLSAALFPVGIHIGLLLLRLSTCLVMFPHGYKKMMSFEDKHEKFMDFMGLGGSTSLILVIAAEVFCTLFLAAGLFTRWVAGIMFFTMAVALFIAHNGEIFGDGEQAFLYMIIYLMLLLSGPGKYSLDHLLFRKYSNAA